VTNSSFTHVALFVEDLDVSIDFYRRYAAMEIVHERRETSGGRAVWLGDGKIAFVLVLVAPGRRSLLRSISRAVARYFPAPHHLGLACESRERVDSLCDLARREGRLRKRPRDAGPVVGYYGMIADPDGYNLEVSYGQEVGPAVRRARGVEEPER
jgi:catechol 2,3-dioxygenase-like lactoylglutathione lyase family enzyme